MSPALQVDSLPAESQGKPKNTGVGSLSLLQRIFLTQESKWGLLHCRWILYPLSYQGSPLLSYIYMSLSHVRLFVTPWTVYIAHQAPPSMGFSMQEYWSGVAMSFSRGSSQPRDRTWVFRILGQTLYPLSHQGIVPHNGLP